MSQVKAAISRANASAALRSRRAVTTTDIPFEGVSEKMKLPKIETFRMAPRSSAWRRWLAEIDQLAIGAAGGQKGDRGGDQRQFDMHHLRCGIPRQNSAQGEGGFLAALDEIHMGVGAVADDHIGAVAHHVRDIGVQVQGLDNRHIGPDCGPDTAGELAVRVVQMGRDHCAVMAEIDRIDRLGQAMDDRIGVFLEHGLLDRALGVAGGQQDRNRGPGSGRVHPAHEGGELLRQTGRVAAGLRHQGIAAHPGQAFEIGLAGRL
jgi:hypothetical protein